MMLRQVYTINDNQLTIKLPDDFKNTKQVLVTIDDVVDTHSEKLLQMKAAATDPLFLADIQETEADFAMIDHETL